MVLTMRGTWKVKGILHITSPQPLEHRGMHPKNYVVRYTADNLGKSLSMADENNGVMFQIPFDGIYNEIIKGGR